MEVVPASPYTWPGHKGSNPTRHHRQHGLRARGCRPERVGETRGSNRPFERSTPSHARIPPPRADHRDPGVRPLDARGHRLVPRRRPGHRRAPGQRPPRLHHGLLGHGRPSASWPSSARCSSTSCRTPLVARRFGVQTDGIELWLLGGMARLNRDAPSPKADGLIAVAGPVASIALGAVFIGAAFGLAALGLWPLIAAMMGWLGRGQHHHRRVQPAARRPARRRPHPPSHPLGPPPRPAAGHPRGGAGRPGARLGDRHPRRLDDASRAGAGSSCP